MGTLRFESCKEGSGRVDAEPAPHDEREFTSCLDLSRLSGAKTRRAVSSPLGPVSEPKARLGHPEHTDAACPPRGWLFSRPPYNTAPDQAPWRGCGHHLAAERQFPMGVL